MMKSKPSQSKFMKIITIPIKALAKARDFYVKTMNNYADNACYGGVSGFSDPLPRSFSTNSVRSTDSDDFKELVRAASTSTLGNRINLNSVTPISNSNDNVRVHSNSNGNGLLKRVPRSASVGMAKIEEDKPIEFHDDFVGKKGNHNHNGKHSKFGIFPRSRTVGSTDKSKSTLFS
ncbi:unnamed protein product [Amaranthus hypochondriacus]